MPNESLHSQFEQPSGQGQPRRRDDARQDEGGAHADAGPDEGMARTDLRPAGPLAGFELLADPRTIAGGSAPRDARDEEVERLRSALHRQTQEIEALRQTGAPSAGADAISAKPTTPPTDSAASVSGDGPPSQGRLLDAAAARRLADEARARERASREALAAAQEALRQQLRTPESSTEPDRHPRDRQGHGGWARRPLAGGDAEPSAEPSAARALSPGKAAGDSPAPAPAISKLDPAAPTPTPTPTPTVPDRPQSLLADDGAEALSEARADLRVLRTTLSIAHETAVAQKEELSSLRDQIAASERELESTRRAASAAQERFEAAAAQAAEAHRAELDRVLEQSALETGRLRERLAANEREAEAREADRTLLRQSLIQREHELAEREARLLVLQDRLDAQEQALEQARRQFRLERSQNTSLQALLGQLRHTLEAQPEALSQSQPDAPGTDDRSAAKVALESANPAAIVGAENDGPARFDSTPLVQTVAPATTPPDLDRLFSGSHEPVEGRPPIFDAWLDDQVRRHFGPLGIDRFVDLLRTPLARRSGARSRDLEILLIGRGAWRWAPQLAEGLVEHGTPSFRIEVADTSPDRGQGAMGAGHRPQGDRPVLDLLSEAPPLDTPSRLADRLSTLRPAVIVCRDFLSHQSDVAPWLDALAAETDVPPGLVFAEQTGLDRSRTPEAIQAIGNRIWELMPDRYTRGADGAPGPASWQEAFAESDSGLANGLLAAVRGRFPFELLAQLGFLSEAFVCGPIGANFDPSAARDRRFLRQIADVDERKIEAGEVTALHWVGVHDPIASPAADPSHR